MNMVSPVASRRFLERKERHRENRNRNAWERACGEAGEIVEMIRERYAPRRIWQWGSLLNPSSFDSTSDIDIAVEGVTDAETYYRLLGEALELASFPLDIVQMEKIEPEFRELIRLKGTVVYEQDRS